MPPLLEQKYDLSSVSLRVPSPLREFVLKWGRLTLPDDVLYWDEEGGCGRETEPHITVLYGLTDSEPPPVLCDLARRTRPFTVRLGPISLFENEHYDVVKFEVASRALVDLSNAIRAACPNENAYPVYVPHCTVAYCKKGTVAGLVGVYPFEADPPISNEFEASELVFSPAGDDADPARRVRVLPLNRYWKESVVEGSAKAFLRQVWDRPWSYRLEPDPSYPGGCFVVFYYRGRPAGTSAARESFEHGERDAREYLALFNDLERRMPFSCGYFDTCWRWKLWLMDHPEARWDEREWQRRDQAQAVREGWRLVTWGDGYTSVKTVDADTPFESDAAAWRFVKQRAQAGSALHAKAVALVNDPSLLEGSAKAFFRRLRRPLLWDWFPDGSFGFPSEAKRRQGSGFVAWVAPVGRRWRIRWLEGGRPRPARHYPTLEAAQEAAEAAFEEGKGAAAL